MTSPMPSAGSEDFQPLQGLRVLDFTRVLAGPYATMVLAELGADVVKVEMPGAGDETRAWGPPFVDEASAYFHAVNRGKRSVALDLTTADGRRRVEKLVASSDVVVENFRPGVTDRLGIGPARVAEIAPQVVYVSMTGFGAVGPMASHAGTEVIVEAESGLMSITGDSGGEPVRFGVAMVDIATGLSGITALLAALIERGRTGRGRHVQVSLFATAVSSLGTVIAAESRGGESRAWGSAHPSIVPYRAFAAADGHLVLGATNDAMFARLASALELSEDLGRPGWAGNAGRVEDREAVEAVISASVARRSVEEVVARLREHRVLVAPVRSVADAARSEQAVSLGLVREEEGLRVARSPLAANGTRHLGAAPGLGEHTDEILAEIDRGSAPDPAPVSTRTLEENENV